MRKSLSLIGALLTLALLCGCGPRPGDTSTTTVTTPDGQATVTTQKDGEKSTVTVNAPDGTYTATSQNSVTEAELGVPFYPGAKAEGGGSYAAVNQAKGQAGKAAGVTLSTPDPVDKVVAFYKDKLGAPMMDMNHEGQRNVSWAKPGANGKGGLMIAISTEKDQPGTKVTIVRTEGM